MTIPDGHFRSVFTSGSQMASPALRNIPHAARSAFLLLEEVDLLFQEEEDLLLPQDGWSGPHGWSGSPHGWSGWYVWSEMYSSMGPPLWEHDGRASTTEGALANEEFH